MKKILFAFFLVPFTFLSAFDLPEEGIEDLDQFHILSVAPMYALTKGIDLATENRCRYFKIVSYEFHWLDHLFHFESKSAPRKGKYLEYKDENLTLSIVGFNGKNKEQFAVDTKAYKDLNDLFE